MDDTNTTTKKIFKVLVARFSKFESDMARLNKRAAKLGCQPVSYLASDVQFSIHTDEFGKKIRHEWHNVEVAGQAPSFGGWTFIGTIESKGEAGNILRSVPGHEIPEQYRTAKPTCDHCRTSRKRKDTFVVKHEDGTTRQIGRQCIRDFLGHASPEMIAQQCEFAASLRDMGDDDSYFGTSHGKPVETTMEVLGYAVAISRRFGFVSGAKARETEGQTASTSSLISFNMFPPTWSRQAMEEWKNSPRRVNVSDDDRGLATTIREWISIQNTDGNQFMANLKVALSCDTCESRDFGIIAAGYMAYDRAVGDAARKAAPTPAKNECFGTVGKREIFELTVVSYNHRETDFGVSTMIKYQDAEGRMAVWFASGELDPTVGEKVKVKATVKKHDSFRGLAQTILSRAVVVEGVA